MTGRCVVAMLYLFFKTNILTPQHLEVTCHVILLHCQYRALDILVNTVSP